MDRPNEFMRDETPIRGETDRGEAAVSDTEEAVSGGTGTAEPPNAAHGGRLVKELTEWVTALAIAGIVVFLVRWFVISPFIVDGPSMEPNFWHGERIMVNKLLYEFRAPKRGEVIVFHMPDRRDLIKRVIGLPGDTVRVEGDKVYVNGQPIEEPYLEQAIAEAHARGLPYNDRDFQETTVPEGTLFVLGDHRNNSLDSRDPSVGFIPLDRVIGRAEFVFWPISHIKYIGDGQ
jgi:signal peptidase I